jgi:hypothetical protein
MVTGKHILLHSVVWCVLKSFACASYIYHSCRCI